MAITKEQLVKDIQSMEKVHAEYSMQLQQLTRAVEQQSGGIQYARMLLNKMEEEEKVSNGVVEEALPSV